jgi:hypothetical protein
MAPRNSDPDWSGRSPWVGSRWIAMIAAAGVLAGCGHASSPSANASHQPAPAATSAAVTKSPRCRVPAPVSLQASLDRAWKHPRPFQVLPFTSTAHGPWVAAQVRSSSFYGVALVNLTTNQTRPIDRFAQSSYQALGAFDGTVAVWKEFHSLNGLDQFSVKEWNAKSGVVRTVGGSHLDPKSGQTFPSPWTEPALGDGRAAWVEGTDFAGRGRLRVLDTTTGGVVNYSTGHPGGAFFIYGHALIWGESTRPGGLTKVFAKSIESGRHVSPPSALAAQRGGSAFATDGHAIAWVGPDHRSLFYSADGSEDGKLLLRLHIGGFNPPTAVHDGIVMSVYSGGVIAVDGQGVATTLVHNGGGVTPTGDGFLVSTPAVGKSATAYSALALVRPVMVRLPPCA